MPLTTQCLRHCLAIVIIVVVSFLLYLSRLTSIQPKQIRENPSAELHDNRSVEVAIESSLSLNATQSKLEAQTRDRWIVVTTESPPTPSIAKLASIPGWNLVVVGNTNTPTNWNYPGCIFLGKEQQKDLEYSVLGLIPDNSYARKNLGYLFAIQHGAQYIYDTDDDNQYFDGILNFSFEATTSGLIYSDNSSSLMNPYAHFGQPSIWPRGLPLDQVTRKNNNEYKLTSLWTPAIQQGLVNGKPDLDALGWSIKSDKTNITFDYHAPPVILPNKVFAPFNSRNTLFHREAFWALFLPPFLSNDLTDIWRGYWAQKLLWTIGQRLAFFPPTPETFLNHDRNLSEIVNQLEISSRTEELLKMLTTWSCGNETLVECVNQLSVDMANLVSWNLNDTELVAAWLNDLEHVGYQFPDLVNSTQIDFKTDERLSTISLPVANHTVYFNPSPELKSPSERRLDLLTLCGPSINSSISKGILNSLNQSVTYSFPNVLLVVLFNEMFFKNVKFLDTLYRDHFPNMVICAPVGAYKDMVKTIDEGFPQWRNRPVTVLKMSTAWYYAYECLIRVMEMNYRVDGYLIMGDDVLLNTWNWASLDLSQVHFIYTTAKLINRNVKKYKWQWWSKQFGRNATAEAFDEIEKLALGRSDQSASESKVTRIMKTFVANRNKNNVNMTVMAIASADIYYVPRSKSNEFIELMKLFLRHRSFLELAVPATMAGLCDAGIGEHVLLKGHGYWGRNRPRVLSLFNATHHYLHPFKLSTIFKDTKIRNNYCDIYVNELLKSW